MLFKDKKHLKILKTISTKLDDNHTFILTYMYYTDKRNKDNNQYRYEGLVVDNSEFEGKIRKIEYEVPNYPWKWNHQVPDDFVISYNNDDTNRKATRFFKSRLKKAVSFDEYLKKINENAVKRYPKDGYLVEGTTEAIEITDKEKLLGLTGKSLSRVRDRAELTFDILSPDRTVRRYNARKTPAK